MNAPALLRELSTRGATVALEGEALRVQPSRVLTDELRAAIRCHKSELLQFLTRENVSREYSQPVPDVAADALAQLSREVEAARRPNGLIQMNARVLVAWREAEAATEMPLTLSGTPRRKYSNEENAGALYDPQAAEEYAHAAFDAGEVTARQRDTLLSYARSASTRSDLAGNRKENNDVK